MKRDTVIGIVGTVLLVAAMVGVFRFEAAQGGGSSWTVTWETAEIEGPGDSGTTAAGVTTPVELELLVPNVTRIEFVLTWTDDVGAADAFELRVTSPAGENATAASETGRLSLVVDELAPVPGEMRLLAATQAEAEARTARDATTRAADGTWGVAVYLERARGVEAPGGVEVQPDPGNAWELTTTLTTYSPRFQRG